VNRDIRSAIEYRSLDFFDEDALSRHFMYLSGLILISLGVYRQKLDVMVTRRQATRYGLCLPTRQGA
tara:strand:+ start:66 stop:266 length:201 start_codon:yes stop_codon:yes gene_type:complete